MAGRPSIGGSSDRGPGGRRQGWRLPATAGSVTALRRGLREFLCGGALSDDERYDLLLAACEATSNAIEHPREPSEPFVDITAGIGDTGVITITVRDHGQWRDAPAGTHRGRGLAMMWMLAATTVAPGPRGTTVTIRSSPRHGRHPVASHGGHEAASGPALPSSAAGAA